MLLTYISPRTLHPLLLSSAVIENVVTFFSTFNSNTRCSVRWSSGDVTNVSFASSRVSDIVPTINGT